MVVSGESFMYYCNVIWWEGHHQMTFYYLVFSADLSLNPIGWGAVFHFSVRCRNPFFGSTQFHWLSVGRDLSLSKVLVAADYSDSVPNSSSYESNQGYHPLEELKVCKRIQEIQLSSAEIARTTVEVNFIKSFNYWIGKKKNLSLDNLKWVEFIW